jgi:hypothetical protein
VNAPGLVQEYWRHKPTGRLWAVELFGGRVIRAIGPLGDDEIDHRVLPYLPYTRRDTRWLNEHRAEFVRAARASDP